MTTFWTYDHLAQVTDGTWRVPPADGGAMLPAAARALAADDDFRGPVLWHDTREVQPGQCYLAIKGENFDGHDFLDHAFEKGAALSIVNAGATQLAQQAVCGSRPILEVLDTVKALQDLARAYRDELTSGGCKVIGVAGSNGKTTTRHLIHHVLTHAGKVGTQSPKSFNNHLGVPLTLLAALPGDDLVACEIGTNHPGEIDFLSAIARPDIAVITSIGEEHLEFFGDIAGVSEEESDILQYVVRGGDAITTGYAGANNKGLPWKYHRKCCSSVSVTRLCRGGGEPHEIGEGGELSDDYWALAKDWRYLGVNPLPSRSIHDNKFLYWDHTAGEDPMRDPPIELPLPGSHNCLNAAFVLTVADLFGVTLDNSRAALASATLPSQRMNVRKIGPEGEQITLIDDAYNANPDSMRIAIKTAARLESSMEHRVVLILGDMFELGQDAPVKHQEVGKQLAFLDGDSIGKHPCVRLVVLIGEMMLHAADPVRTAWTYRASDRLHTHTQWSDDLPEKVAALLQPGDTVLLKASRGMRLERLIPAIEERFGKVKSPESVTET